MPKACSPKLFGTSEIGRSDLRENTSANEAEW
jgi:hypothetical protein